MNNYLLNEFLKEMQKKKKDEILQVLEEIIKHYDDDYISNFILHFVVD